MFKKEISFFIILFMPVFLSCHMIASGMNSTDGFPPESDSDTKQVCPTLKEKFGIKGDSITDDTEAIQKAFESGVGQLNFPSGVYRITRTIEILLDKTGPIAFCGTGTAQFVMDGPGPAFKIVGTHEGRADPPTVKPNVWKNQRMPLIDGLEIVGNHPEAIGIEATGTMQMTITRVLIRDALHGIHLTNRNRNVIISECHIYNNRKTGIFLDAVNLHQINITNCHISYNKEGGIVVRHGDVHNLQIGTCDIEYNMDRNGPPAANILIDMTEGNMLEGAITGCTIQHDYISPGSSNIRLIGRGAEERGKIGNISISANQLSETVDNVHIKFGRGIIITGNTFYMSTNHSIRIEESDHIQIGTNLIDRNPHYGQRIMNSSDNVTIKNSNNITISDLHINNVKHSPGIVMENCQNFNVMNSTIIDCFEGGISIKGSKNGKVTGNLISFGQYENKKPNAIHIENGTNMLITTNYNNGKIFTSGIVENVKIINNYAY